jgi:hypothetical protein
VVEGADKLKLHADSIGIAAEQALDSDHFEPERGMVFGLLGGINHSLGMYNLDNEKGLWLDPNYGVWIMKFLNMVDAMEYLFEKTGVNEEKGVYQENGHGVPTGFENTIWAVNSD